MKMIFGFAMLFALADSSFAQTFISFPEVRGHISGLKRTDMPRVLEIAYDGGTRSGDGEDPDALFNEVQINVDANGDFVIPAITTGAFRGSIALSAQLIHPQGEDIQATGEEYESSRPPVHFSGLFGRVYGADNAVEIQKDLAAFHVAQTVNPTKLQIESPMVNLGSYVRAVVRAHPEIRTRLGAARSFTWNLLGTAGVQTFINGRRGAGDGISGSVSFAKAGACDTCLADQKDSALKTIELKIPAQSGLLPDSVSQGDLQQVTSPLGFLGGVQKNTADGLLSLGRNLTLELVTVDRNGIKNSILIWVGQLPDVTLNNPTGNLVQIQLQDPAATELRTTIF